MSEFRVARARDAWASIRGYVYQASLTVQRWLTLEPNEILELEHGEDIDVVSRCFGEGPREEARLLEQVKRLGKGISLRSGSVVEFLANSLDHQAANPQAELRFRFLTNAEPTRETPSNLRGVKGIEAWEALRRLSFAQRVGDAHLAGIMTLLRSVARPTLPDATWARFQAFVAEASLEGFASLIEKTEFCCGAGDHLEIRRRATKILVERGLAGDEDAEAGFYCLLGRVLDVLSTPGAKVLRSGDVAATLGKVRTGAGTRKVSDLIARLAEWEGVAQGLSQRLDQHEEAIAQLGRRVAGGPESLPSPVLSDARVVLTDPPQLPTVVVPRQATLQSAAGTLGPGKWLALVGKPGLGKSIAALLVCQERGSRSRWLRLRGLTAEQSADFLAREMLRAEVGDEPAVVVADDLPRVLPREMLAEVLVRFTGERCRSGSVVISTSNFRLPDEVREAARGYADEVELPPFNDAEVGEFLRRAGATTGLLEPRVVSTVNALVRGHPTLLQAACSYLRARDWRLDVDVMTALFAGDFSREVEEQFQHVLSRTVSDEARELIYRLDLVVGAATEEALRAIADAPPPIARSFEALAEIVDIWIQRSSTGYLLSPLVKRLGQRNLAPDARRSVARALAKEVLSHKSVNQFDALAGIHYYLAADEADHAGWLLVSLLGSLEKAPAEVEDFGLLGLWAEAELPERMHLGVRLMLRGTQARVLPKRGRDVSFILTAIEALVARTPAELTLAAVGAVTSAAMSCSASTAVQVLRLLGRVLPKAEGAYSAIGEEEPKPGAPRAEDVLWVLVQNIRSPEALDAWSSAWSGLSAGQRSHLTEVEYYPLAAMSLASGVWGAESAKPSPEQDWVAVVGALERLERAASNGGAALLAACALRSRIIVEAEYRDRLAEAAALGEAGLRMYSACPESAFLIRESVGRQYAIRETWDQARAWFAGAFDAPTPWYDILRFFGLLQASVAAGHENPAQAVPLLRDATALASASQYIGEMDRVGAMAELAIAEWLADGLAASFARWDDLLSTFLALPERSSGWRDLGVLVGHCLGYLASLANTQKAPERTPDGSEYAAPYLGMFHSVTKGMWERRPVPVEGILCAQLVLLAEGVGAEDRADAWALRGIEFAEGPENALARGLLYQRALPVLLQANEFTLAILRAGGMTEARPRRPELDERLQREFLVLPVVTRVATLALEDRALSDVAAQECIDAFLKLAERSTIPEPWRDAAQLLKQGVLSRQGAQRMLAAPAERSCVKGEWPLHGAANVLATIQDDCPLAVAAAVQTNVMRLAVQAWKGGGVTSRVLWPFIEAFWRRVIRERPFLLGSPRFVESELGRVHEVAPHEALRRLLTVVADDQRARISVEDRNWLATGT